MGKKAFIVFSTIAALVNPPYAQEYSEGEIIVSLREELSGSVRKLSTGKIVSGMLDGDDPEWAVRLDMVKAAGFNQRED